MSQFYYSSRYLHLVAALLLLFAGNMFVSTPMLAQTVAQSSACPDGLPFMGIGLGYNQYTLAQVTDLGGGDLCQRPLVYNWSLGDSPQTPENSPHIDFPERYVPMMWGCGSIGPQQVERFLAEQKYAGPLLVFNEPDRADQADCTPTRAAGLLNELQHIRVAHEVATGNMLQLYVGGPARSDSGIAWMNEFRASYIEMYGADLFGKDGTLNPVAQGVHFHLYPRFAYPDGAGSLADVSEQLAEWDLWLMQNDLRAWVTEVGVLHAPYQPLPKEEYVYFLERVLPLLFWNERIDHAFIFTLNSVSGTNSAEFAKSALIEDGVETSAYQFVQDICGAAGSGYCAPDAKRLILAKKQAEGNEVATEWLHRSGKSMFTRPNAESYQIGYAKKK